MLLETLKRNGVQVLDRYSRTRWFRYLSPANYTLWKALERAAAEYVRGSILDAGAGRKPYETLLLQHGERYFSVDWEDRGTGVDATGDLHSLQLDRTFDTIVCTQVLEHTRHPVKVLERLRDHLSPGGRLIVTVPHLSMLHNEPHDYFRYTRYGLDEIFRSASLDPVEITPVGGLWTFVGLLVSQVWVNLPFKVPGIGFLALVTNVPVVLGWILLDRVLGFPSLLPANYLAIAENGDPERPGTDGRRPKTDGA
jgi:SAM-dependent methyltransferase